MTDWEHEIDIKPPIHSNNSYLDHEQLDPQLNMEYSDQIGPDEIKYEYHCESSYYSGNDDFTLQTPVKEQCVMCDMAMAAVNVATIPFNIALLAAPEIQKNDNYTPTECQSNCNACFWLKQSRQYFTCGKCIKTFYSKNDLDDHMKIHDGISCPICAENLPNQMDSSKHEQCEMSFYYKNELTQHLKSHAPEGSNFCEHCDKFFDSIEDLTRHEARVYGKRSVSYRPRHKLLPKHSDHPIPHCPHPYQKSNKIL